jgi:hypothetical protein
MVEALAAVMVVAVTAGATVAAAMATAVPAWEPESVTVVEACTEESDSEGNLALTESRGAPLEVSRLFAQNSAKNFRHFFQAPIISGSSLARLEAMTKLKAEPEQLLPGARGLGPPGYAMGSRRFAFYISQMIYIKLLDKETSYRLHKKIEGHSGPRLQVSHWSN